LPYVLSGEGTYYIGFSDMTARSLGYHIKDEMNGFWVPPLRILKWITVSVGEKSMSPTFMEIGITSRKFYFSNFTIELMTSYEKAMAIRFTKNIEYKGIVNIHLELGIIPVWFSEERAKFTIVKEKNGISISEDNYGMRIRIYSWPHKNYLLNDNTVTYSLNEDTTIIISASETTLVNGTLITEPFSGYKAKRESEFYSRLNIKSTKKIEKALDLAMLNLEWLILNVDGIGRGVIAGYPEFPWFFGIDTYYCRNGMMISGMEKEYFHSLNILEKYAEIQKGRIPHEIVSNGRIFNKGNVVESIVYPKMIYDLYNWTGDISILKNRIRLIEDVFGEYLTGEISGTGIMEDPHAGAGLDIDVLCNYIESLKALILISEKTGLMEDSANRMRDEIANKTKFLEREMWIKEISAYGDRYRDGVPQFNGFWTTLIPFSTDQASKEHFREFVNKSIAYSRIVSNDGIMVYPGGNVMPIGNSMMVKSCFNYGESHIGMNFFNLNMSVLGKYSFGCFPEISNNPSGCFIQSWSAALFIENLLYDIFGVKIHNENLGVSNSSPIPEIFNGTVVSGIIFRDKKYNISIKDSKTFITQN